MRERVRRNRLLVEWPLDEGGSGAANSAAGRRSGRRRGRAVRSVTVNLGESPIGWLRARGHISSRQHAAGEQLRADWESAGLSPCVTMHWLAVPPDRGRRPPPRADQPGRGGLAAKRRFDEAVAAVGPGLSDILWRVVCAGEGMGEAETALGWPARAGKLVLRLALDRLADHYRLR